MASAYMQQESAMAEEKSNSLRDLVAEVSAAYFANSHASVAEIGTVIAQIAQSLAAVGETPPQTADSAETLSVRRLSPAQIRRSVTPDAIISFEDGRGYKTLRRHLTGRDMTPQQYREKWGLPNDYPMVASSYSAARSQIAKRAGLGARGQVKRSSGATKAGL